MPQRLELTIVLPTLNEAANVARIISDLDGALAGIGWEALFVDDNSPDGTADVLRAIATHDPRIRVIERIGRRGLASAVIEGWMAASAPVIAVMDADGQHDAAVLPAMLRAIAAGACDIAVGSRFADGASTADWGQGRREAGSKLANRLARRLTGLDLTDPMSGFFMAPAPLLQKTAPQLSGIGFKVLLDLIARLENRPRIAEFPLQFGARGAGESKLDRVIAFEFAVGLYDRWFGDIIPTRFALFGTIGTLGVLVHLAVLGLLHRGLAVSFIVAQIAATLVAMTANFALNNSFTYRDKRLAGWPSLLRGWLGFCGFCAVGAIANVAVATLLKQAGGWWWAAAIGGITVGAVWNYALSSRFVWGRY